jgi:hypothetical protein
VNTPIIDDILATHEQGFDFRGWVEMDKLANELRALLAERDRLVGEVTEWEGHAQTYEAGMVAARRELAALRTPAPPRRPKEYKGVTYREGYFRYRDCGTGTSEAVAACQWWIHIATDADHAALLALRDDPQPVETLEKVIGDAFRDCPNGGDVYEYAANAIRTHLATQQPQPVSVAYTFVGGTGETLEEVVGKAWGDALKESGNVVEFIANALRAHLATQPQAITPEQAVSVLVEGGAKLEQVTYRATVGSTHMTAGTRILILPIATPEGGK